MFIHQLLNYKLSVNVEIINKTSKNIIVHVIYRAPVNHFHWFKTLMMQRMFRKYMAHDWNF